jgi:hypothetical protein
LRKDHSRRDCALLGKDFGKDVNLGFPLVHVDANMVNAKAGLCGARDADNLWAGRIRVRQPLRAWKRLSANGSRAI